MEQHPITPPEEAPGGQKKNRKKYTLTKQRELWTPAEHSRFIEALQRYSRDWRKIEQHVGSKTVVQIRSHAQKYFQKVQKTGSTEPIPPPRPKRKPSDTPTDGRARTSDRSGSSGKQAAGAGGDSGGEEGGSNRAISSPAGLDSIAEGAAHADAYRQACSHDLQYVYMFLSSLLEDQPPEHASMLLQTMSPRDRHLVGELMGTMRDELQSGSQQQQQQLQLQQLQQQQVEADSAAAAAAAAALAASGSLGPLLPILQQPQQQQQPQPMQLDGLEVPGAHSFIQMLMQASAGGSSTPPSEQQPAMMPMPLLPTAAAAAAAAEVAAQLGGPGGMAGPAGGVTPLVDSAGPGSPSQMLQ